MSDIHLDRELSSYLVNRGVSLQAFGSSEFAISQRDAISFLELLERCGKFPLGIEVWKRQGEVFSIDSLGGWYSTGADIRENIDSARDFLCNHILIDDFVTVQFD